MLKANIRKYLAEYLYHVWKHNKLNRMLQMALSYFEEGEMYINLGIEKKISHHLWLMGMYLQLKIQDFQIW